MRITCREYREELVEWARGAQPSGALRVHAEACAECGRFLEEQQALSAVFSRLAAQQIPSADAWAAPVMAQFDRRARSARIRVMGWFAAGAVAAAACLALMVTPTKSAAPPAAAESSQFIPMPYTVPLSPEERTTVVRMDIPVSALIAAGFQLPATDPTAAVQADVLVSQDGRARAIRPITFLNSN